MGGLSLQEEILPLETAVKLLFRTFSNPAPPLSIIQHRIRTWIDLDRQSRAMGLEHHNEGKG